MSDIALNRYGHFVAAVSALRGQLEMQGIEEFDPDPAAQAIDALMRKAYAEVDILYVRDALLDTMGNGTQPVEKYEGEHQRPLWQIAALLILLANYEQYPRGEALKALTFKACENVLASLYMDADMSADEFTVLVSEQVQGIVALAELKARDIEQRTLQ